MTPRQMLLEIHDLPIRVYLMGDFCTDHRMVLEENPSRQQPVDGSVMSCYTARLHQQCEGMAGAVASVMSSMTKRCEIYRESLRALHPYSHKWRIEIKGQRSIWIDETREADRSKGYWEGTSEDMFRRAPRAHKVIVISDYGKGAVTQESLAFARELSESVGFCPIIVDPARGRPWHVYGAVDVIKCNMAEVHWVGLEDRLSREMLPTVITDAGAGMMIRERDRDRRHVAAYEPDGAYEDSVGCGDVVMGVISLAMAVSGTRELDAACRLASIAAGIKTRRYGTFSMPSFQDLWRELDQIDIRRESGGE